MQILAFDIGIKNFCYCIEKYNLNNNAIEFGKTIKLLNTDISDNGLQYLTKTVFNNISTLLENIKDELNETDVILIEKQVPKNICCIKLAQHVWTWFNIKYPNIVVVNYHAMYKTSVFGVKHETYNQRKKWSVNKAKEIMKIRNDTITMAKLMRKKSDDMADCILMCLSYVIKNF